MAQLRITPDATYRTRAKAGAGRRGMQALPLANSGPRAPALPRRAGASVAADLVPASDENQAPAGAQSASTALLHSQKATVTLPLSHSMQLDTPVAALRSRHRASPIAWLRASRWSSPRYALRTIHESIGGACPDACFRPGEAEARWRFRSPGWAAVRPSDFRGLRRAAISRTRSDLRARLCVEERDGTGAAGISDRSRTHPVGDRDVVNTPARAAAIAAAAARSASASSRGSSVMNMR
jgi:hypothetical protein